MCLIWQVLEALALGEPPPLEAVRLEPDLEGMRASAGPEVERFKARAHAPCCLPPTCIAVYG